MSAATASPAVAESAPRLRTRLLRRAGRWGVRGLRNSMLAVASSSAARDGRTLQSHDDVMAGLSRFGIRGLQQSDVSSLEVPCTVDAAMSHFVGTTISASRYAAVKGCFAELLRAVGSASKKISLRLLCASVQIQRHPDVEAGMIPLREALFTFFIMWGTDTIDAFISEAAWNSYWVDWSVSFVSDTEFRSLLERLWQVQIPPPAVALHIPSRAESDSMFSSIDQVGNGELCLAELDLACVQMWPGLDYKNALMRAYKLADLRGKGTLSRSEFRVFLAYLPIYVSLAEKFRTADVGHHGALSFEELKNAKSALGLGEISDVELRQLFRTADVYVGGHVNFDELCIMVAKALGDRFMARETNEFAKKSANPSSTPLPQTSLPLNR